MTPRAFCDSEVDTQNCTALTIVTSNVPAVLTKRFQLDSSGDLKKAVAAAMSRGHATRREFWSAEELAKILQSLRQDQALMFGLHDRTEVDLVSQRAWAELGRPENPQPRTKERWPFPMGPAVMLLDVDAPRDGSEPIPMDVAIRILREVAPELENATFVAWPSSSSHIHRTDTDEPITGLRGYHIYLTVAHGTDIPRTAVALSDRLWASGHGRIEISKAGTLLPRTLFDSSVHQGNRLAFAAGADCMPPLEQRRGHPVIFHGLLDDGPVDTAMAIPDPDPATVAAARAARKRAEIDIAPRARQVREAYIAARAREIAGSGATSERIEALEGTLRRGVERYTLAGDHPIIVIRDDGTTEEVTVGEILDHPERFHQARTLDPVEPSYDGDRAVGKLFLFSARPVLHSFAHGHRTFRLLRQPRSIEIADGNDHDVVNQSLEVLQEAPEIFELGTTLVHVVEGSVAPLDDYALAFHLGGLVNFWRWTGKDEKRIQKRLNPTPGICRQIVNLTPATRRLKPLAAVVRHPTMRLDGTLILKPGYDEETKILIVAPDDANVPELPTEDQCRAALDALVRPFVEFPFASSLARSVHLAAVLSVVVRPVCPTCPAFGYDAPIQGSGKTLLARCLQALVGEEPALSPAPQRGNDDETRKRLLSELSTGRRVSVWDNLVGEYDSPAFAAALTSEVFADRVLGLNQIRTVPNRAVFVLTGNNLSITGDLSRRLLVSRIVPDTDRPYARQFDMEPESYVRRHRHELVTAALTLLRGWITSSDRAGGIRALGRMASFEAWDDLVRQTVAWIGRTIAPGEYDDVMSAVDVTHAADPEAEALDRFHDAWLALFGDRWVTASDVAGLLPLGFDDASDGGAAESFRNAYSDLVGGERQRPESPKSVGKVLAGRKDRIVRGRRVEARQDQARNAQMWRVAVVRAADVEDLC